jgi:two-component system sensor histidine kinase/response regulator
MQFLSQNLLRLQLFVKSIGVTPEMEEYEKRKMSIFNMLNLLGIITGIVVPVIGLVNGDHLPPLAWFVAYSPLSISITVLWMNHEKYHELSRLCYFSLYPLATCLVYLGKVDVGIELFFILYMVLSVFFLQNFLYIIFSFSLSTICYFLSSLVFRDFYFQLKAVNYSFYLFNHLTALGLIFYALYLIKKENTGYQRSLLAKAEEIRKRNFEVEAQKQEIVQKAGLLEQQTRELVELNQVKNKLFSVIAHDLKTPMYALRNLFVNMQQQKMPAKEIKSLMPAIVNEMNFATSLMENLLVWARNQMKNASAQPELLDVDSMVKDVMQLLHLQASAKKIYFETKLEQPLFCYADKEMVKLVLRNLLSNAIKFTPEKGNVSVTAVENQSTIEISVEDTGVGISEDKIEQLFGNNYYSTRGTADESGTGIGLLLCKDFLEKNGGSIRVKSEEGKGSVFSFTLPRRAV